MKERIWWGQIGSCSKKPRVEKIMSNSKTKAKQSKAKQSSTRVFCLWWWVEKQQVNVVAAASYLLCLLLLLLLQLLLLLLLLLLQLSILHLPIHNSHTCGLQGNPNQQQHKSLSTEEARWSLHPPDILFLSSSFLLLLLLLLL